LHHAPAPSVPRHQAGAEHCAAAVCNAALDRAIFTAVILRDHGCARRMKSAHRVSSRRERQTVAQARAWGQVPVLPTGAPQGRKNLRLGGG
jgi:hypothetical protein